MFASRFSREGVHGPTWGTMCRNIAEPNPTMNYGWLTPASEETELRRVVLHEFGHAIGLIHEHQNPKGGIKWNKAAVINDLSGPPNNWDAATIENNMFRYYPPRDVVATSVDPLSIMMYPIPKSWTVDGFSAGLNGELSPNDKTLVRSAYPALVEMNTDHFAIVIGLSRYPRLADPPPDLHGPENDADAVCAWLTDPSGGALPETNIKVVRSGAFGAPPTGAPTRDDLEEAFLWLDGLAKRNQEEDGKGRVVGHRLFLYAAGHGFSPRFRQGCLLAGNAAEEQYSANVFPSAWIEWLQDAGYFRECVLWLDCCMDRQVLTQPTPPPLTPISGGEPRPVPHSLRLPQVDR